MQEDDKIAIIRFRYTVGAFLHSNLIIETFEFTIELHKYEYQNK